MTSLDPASALIDAAHAFDRAAAEPGSHARAPEALASMREAMQELSTAWYRVAADAARADTGPLSREHEVRLIVALQDVGAAFARCARACGDGRSAIAPVVGRVRSADAWFAYRRPGTERVA